MLLDLVQVLVGAALVGWCLMDLVYFTRRPKAPDGVETMGFIGRFAAAVGIIYMGVAA